MARHLHFDIQLSQALFDRAHERAMSIFSDWEWTPPEERRYLSIRRDDETLILDVVQDVVAPLAFAERYFGDTWPDSLIKKLRNRTQTVDTLFEMICLGEFSLRHKVVYEPKIESGKVPDLRIEPPESPAVYVECKSHHFTESKYCRTFKAVTALCQAFAEERILKASWAEGLRTEIYLTGRPSDAEIQSSRRAIAELQMQQLQAGCQVSERIIIKGPCKNNFLGAGVMRTICRTGSQISVKRSH